ncbi:4-oxalocrotonate tautomerase [Rhizobiales bacterium RZME27]|uniref:4-oxalocrotonate tautomerase n=1 Tax=Endobacterium cereale TaxID=2663029 RepID=A0A6A8AAC0_9HYPH|nr:tautomerase family protein [Endobacterium cereale]MEB2847826.1 tautomerase family protein [Endobacterium cereale]MQY46837.1 4-oxalocrotonate tautomerase [Endobacterium cereale]
MPHVIVKMYEGKGLPEKQALAQAVAETVAGFGYDIRKVSVSIDDIRPENWMEAVYHPDIMNRRASLVRAPSYGPVSEKF